MHGRVAAAVLGLAAIAAAIGAVHEARRPKPSHLVPFSSWVEVSNWVRDPASRVKLNGMERWDARTRQYLSVTHNALRGTQTPYASPGGLAQVGAFLALLEQDNLVLYRRSAGGLQKIESHSLAPRCPDATGMLGRASVFVADGWVVVETRCGSDAETRQNDIVTRVHRFQRNENGALGILSPIDLWHAHWAREMPRGRLLFQGGLNGYDQRPIASLVPRIEHPNAAEPEDAGHPLLRPQDIFQIGVPITRSGERSIEWLISCDPKPIEMSCNAQAVATSTYPFEKGIVDTGGASYLATRRDMADSMDVVRLPFDGSPPNALRIRTEQVRSFLGPGPDGSIAALTFQYEGKQFRPSAVVAGPGSFGAWGTLPRESDVHALVSLPRSGEEWSPWASEPDGVMAAYTNDGLTYARNTLDEPATIWTYDPRSRLPPKKASIPQSADSLKAAGPFVVVSGLQGKSPAITVFKPPALPTPDATLVLHGLDPEKRYLRSMTIQSVSPDTEVLLLEALVTGEAEISTSMRFMQLDGKSLSELGELPLPGCPRSQSFDCEVSLAYREGKFYLYQGAELVEAIVEGGRVRETGRWVLPQ